MTSNPEAAKTVVEQIDALFAPWNRMDAPGFSIGVVRDGETIYRRGFGMASLESRVAIAPATRLRIGSTSKHFTGLLALLLQEDGKLDLDVPIRTYVPELTGPAGDPSTRLLLQHRGGGRCYLDLSMLSRGMATPPIGDALQAQVRQTASNFAPGTAMIYNNGGYHLVSIAIERVGGAPFEDQLKTRLFDPVGMADTLSLPSDHEIVPGMATMHLPTETGGWRRGLFPSDEVKGEGAIVSTVDDMIRWMAHLRRRDRFGSAESWRQLTERPAYADGTTGVYALGLMFHDYRGLPTLHHAGGVIGGSSQMLTFPDHGLDIVILVNGAPGANPSRLAEQVADIVLADQVGPEPARTMVAGREALVGRWWSDETGLSYDAADEDGALKLQSCNAPRPFDLTPNESGGLAWPGMDMSGFRIDPKHAADGSIAISFGGTTARYRKVDRVDPPSADFAAAAIGHYAGADAGATVEIRRDGDRLVARFAASYGATEVVLHQLGDSAAEMTPIAFAGPNHGVLGFERGNGRFSGFRLNSHRSRGLAFRRSPDR